MRIGTSLQSPGRFTSPVAAEIRNITGQCFQSMAKQQEHSETSCLVAISSLITYYILFNPFFRLFHISTACPVRCPKVWSTAFVAKWSPVFGESNLPPLSRHNLARPSRGFCCCWWTWRLKNSLKWPLVGTVVHTSTPFRLWVKTRLNTGRHFLP